MSSGASGADYRKLIMANESGLIKAMLAREATTIDPEFMRSAQAYSTSNGVKTGVFRNERNVMYWENCQKGRQYIWTSK